MLRYLPFLIASGLLSSAFAAFAAVPQAMADRVRPKVALHAEPFEPEDVHLLDGPFKHAMELDHKYLLSLDPDRLLYNFRITAGLPATAEPYGGWEKPDCEVRGHFTGHYLSACARMYACTGDVEMKRRAENMAAEMAKCQAKMGTGYLSAYPEELIERVIALKQVWAPWYTLHKVLAGLLDVYRYCGDKQALTTATRFCDWIDKRMSQLSDEQMERMLGNEHGGMNEVLTNIYAATGNSAYLKLALRFNHHRVIDPLSRKEDRLTGLHANTQIPKLIGTAREYEMTGDPALATASKFFWETVTKERSYVIGGHSDGEMFSDKAHLSQHLSATTTETCNTYNMLKLTGHLFTWEPKAEYADYYERALYNHILASQNPKTGMMCYYVPLKSGTEKVYNTPDDSFWCCTGTGVENHARYGDAIYFHSGKQALYVNLFIASELKWNGVTVRQETQFPTEGATRLTFTCEKPSRFTLFLRHPGWCGSGFRVRVNGKEVLGGAPSSFVGIARTWKSGDRVEVTMPLELHTEAFRDNPRRVAFLDGPIVLASPVVRTGASLSIVSKQVPQPAACFRPVAGESMTFVANGLSVRTNDGKASSKVELTPFYAMHDRPYEVYWDVLTSEQLQKQEDERKAEAARVRELDAKTVDVVRPGRGERSHKLAGEKMGDGLFSDRHWRHATDGGWFSWDLKVAPDADQDLYCLYWGSDVGREFDVLVDGVRIATQRLQNNRPDQFFDQTYRIPADLVKGKSKVTVRFQAHPGGMAGGVFECRIVKR